jgi:sensor histidine kinase regulating citrate/malate metabolism
MVRRRFARFALLALPTLLVLACVGGTTAIAVAVQRDGIRATTTARVTEVSTELAELQQVRTVLEDLGSLEEATAELQPLASLVERAAGVDYVVVIAPDERRITHPTRTERGEIVSTDAARVLAGETVVNVMDGTIGRTLRAKVPVIGSDGSVVGAVSTGILEKRMTRDIEQALWRLLPWNIGALVIGMAASTALTTAMHRRIRLHDEAARELEHVSATAGALREQSHEFDTRLHVIRGLVAHGDRAEALGYIDSAARVTTVANPALASIPPLLRATLEALGAELAAYGTRLDLDVDITHDADDQLVLVLANLCRNAGEAGAHAVRCELRETDGRFHGVVLDDGPGIPAAHASQIFARGFSTKPDPTGTGRGIGLDLVRRTIVARGGSIEVSSDDGTRFAFDMEVLR